MGDLTAAPPGGARDRAWTAPIAIACLLAALAAPALLDAGAPERAGVAWMTVAVQALLLATVASSWNIVGGHLGCIDLGHAAYFGLGAYGTGTAMTVLGLNLPSALAAGGILAAATAAAAGTAILRLHGATFAIASLGALVAVREVVRVAGPLSGGGRGLTLPPPDPAAVYYAALALFALAVALSWLLRRTSLWPLLLAVREDEQAAAARGVPTIAVKRAVFAAAASMTGVAGGLWAYQSTFIDPDLAFADAQSLDMITAALLGGLGTIAGPLVGSAILFAGRLLLWPQSAPYHHLLQGLVLIGVVRWLPRGVVGGLSRRRADVMLPQGLDEPIREPQATPERAADAAAAGHARAPAAEDGPRPPGGGAAPSAPSETLLSVRGLRVTIDGTAVLDGADLTVRRGQIVGVIGPNGSGKTTLADCVSGLRPFDAGTIRLAGRDLARQPAHRIARSGLARTFQVRRVYPQLSVADNLLLCSRSMMAAIRRPPSPQVLARAQSVLADLGLEDATSTQAGNLPASRQRLLEIGMALMLEPEVLVLDEATAGVAPAQVETVKQVVRSRAEAGQAVVVVEHDVGVVADLCHLVVVLDRGRVVTEGTPASVIASEAIEIAYFGTETV